MPLFRLVLPAAAGTLEAVLDLARDAGGRHVGRLRALSGSSVGLYAAPLGEKPQVVKLLERDAAGNLLRVLVPVPGTCSDDPCFAAAPASPGAAGVLGRAEYAAALVAEVERLPAGRRRSYTRYFVELNLNTHPCLVGPLVASVPYRGPSQPQDQVRRIELAKATLCARLVARARHVRSHGVLPPAQPLPAEDPYRMRLTRADVQVLSTLQVTIARANLQSLAALEETYEMFANGELRLQLSDQTWTTQPSSGYYFLFGEFALLCLEEGIDSDFWGEAARVLVRTQRLFAALYGPKDPRSARFLTYEPCAFDPRRQWTASEKAELARRYERLDSRGLMLQAAHNALELLPGEF